MKLWAKGKVFAVIGEKKRIFFGLFLAWYTNTGSIGPVNPECCIENIPGPDHIQLKEKKNTIQLSLHENLCFFSFL